MESVTSSHCIITTGSRNVGAFQVSGGFPPLDILSTPGLQRTSKQDSRKSPPPTGRPGDSRRAIGEGEEAFAMLETVSLNHSVCNLVRRAGPSVSACTNTDTCARHPRQAFRGPRQVKRPAENTDCLNTIFMVYLVV